MAAQLVRGAGSRSRRSSSVRDLWDCGALELGMGELETSGMHVYRSKSWPISAPPARRRAALGTLHR
jgi:hypothetical protein